MDIKQIERYCKSYIQREEQLINTDIIPHSSEYFILKEVLELILQYESVQRELEDLVETNFILKNKSTLENKGN